MKKTGLTNEMITKITENDYPFKFNDIKSWNEFEKKVAIDLNGLEINDRVRVKYLMNMDGVDKSFAYRGMCGVITDIKKDNKTPIKVKVKFYIESLNWQIIDWMPIQLEKLNK